MVQQDEGGAGYLSPSESFAPKPFTEQQHREKVDGLSLSSFRAQRKAAAEDAIVSGRAQAERVRERKEEKRIEAKRIQREVYEKCVTDIAERERRRARNWM